MIRKIIAYIKKHWLISLIVCLVVAGGAFFIFRGSDAPVQDVVAAERRDIALEISVTGRVKSAQAVDLSFERSGRVWSIRAAVGDRVGVGSLIAALSSADLAAQKKEAEADLAREEAKLAELERGTRPEELALQETKVKNAEIALGDAKQYVVDKIQEAYTQSDDAVHNKADQFFTNPRTSTPRIEVSAEPQLRNDIEFMRTKVEASLVEWNKFINTESSFVNLGVALSTSVSNTNSIKDFLDKAAFILNALSPNATTDAFKTNISVARTSIATALANFTAAGEKLRTSESSLAVTQRELDLKKAGATVGDIDAQKAARDRARASVDVINAEIAKAVIAAPLNGVLTRLDLKVGQSVSANTVVAAMISESDFQIEINMPEADIAAVEPASAARVTLDAYGGDVVFDARVIKVDPAETIIDGVATYKVTLAFLKKDDRIKSGMTANVDILSARRENVIVIPQRAVREHNQKKTVSVIDGKGESRDIEVKTGLRGSDGFVEILDGLREGDRVVVFSGSK